MFFSELKRSQSVPLLQADICSTELGLALLVTPISEALIRMVKGGTLAAHTDKVSASAIESGPNETED